MLTEVTDDILRCIFLRLRVEDRKPLACVCRRFAHVARMGKVFADANHAVSSPERADEAVARGARYITVTSEAALRRMVELADARKLAYKLERLTVADWVPEEDVLLELVSRLPDIDVVIIAGRVNWSSLRVHDGNAGAWSALANVHGLRFRYGEYIETLPGSISQLPLQTLSVGGRCSMATLPTVVSTLTELQRLI